MEKRAKANLADDVINLAQTIYSIITKIQNSL